MKTIDEFDMRECPYCGTTRTGARTSEIIRSRRKQTRFCTKCHRTYYVFFRDNKIVDAEDDAGNKLLDNHKKNE